MKLENQLVNFELSKRLKELNYKQDSLRWWHQGNEKFFIDSFHATTIYTNVNERIVSAYSVAELGEMLKDYKDNDWYSWYDEDDEYNKGKWRSGLIVGNYEGGLEKDDFEQADTEANVRAKILIYLKESKDK